MFNISKVVFDNATIRSLIYEEIFFSDKQPPLSLVKGQLQYMTNRKVIVAQLDQRFVAVFFHAIKYVSEKL